MSILVSNGSKLYRRDSSLVRTPIRVTLQPDQKKILQMGDESKRGADGYLHGGFTGGNTSSSTVQSVGYQLCNHIVNGSPVWLDASGSHDPEYVWYQGAYSTSAAYVSTGKYLSEAYAAFAGFHFSVPSDLAGLYSSVTVKFLNMGTCICKGPAIDASSSNFNWVSTGYGTWNVDFHFLNTATCNYHPRVLVQYPYDTVDISTGYGTTGSFRGTRDLWELGGGSGSVDGYIPTLTTPVTQSYELGSETLASFIANGGGWIVPAFLPTIASTTDYLPYYIPSSSECTQNYWACASLRQVTVELLIDE